MISNADNAPATPRDVLVSRLVAQIAGAAAASDRGLEHVEELAQGVAAFLEREHGAFCVESPYVRVLASRALWSVGQQELARRLLLFGTGVVRTSEWLVTGGDKLLVLDLERLDFRRSGAMELALFRSLAVVTEAVADSWNATSGRGALGLRNAGATARSLLNCPRGGRRVGALVDEMKRACADRLDLVRRTREWAHSPRVLNLDI